MPSIEMREFTSGLFHPKVEKRFELLPKELVELARILRITVLTDELSINKIPVFDLIIIIIFIPVIFTIITNHQLK